MRLNRLSHLPTRQQAPDLKSRITRTAALVLGFMGAFYVPQGAHAGAMVITEVAVPGADSTNLRGINDAGVVAGSFGVNGPTGTVYTAFTYDGSSYSPFSVPGSTGTFGRGINSLGEVVGDFGTSTGGA